MRRILLALPFSALSIASAHAANDAKPTEELTCSNIVKAGDTAKTIEARYGGQTAIEEITGAEGATAKGWRSSRKTRRGGSSFRSSTTR